MWSTALLKRATRSSSLPILSHDESKYHNLNDSLASLDHYAFCIDNEAVKRHRGAVMILMYTCTPSWSPTKARRLGKSNGMRTTRQTIPTQKRTHALQNLARATISVVLDVNVDWVRKVPTKLFRFFLSKGVSRNDCLYQQELCEDQGATHLQMPALH